MYRRLISSFVRISLVSSLNRFNFNNLVKTHIHQTKGLRTDTTYKVRSLNAGNTRGYWISLHGESQVEMSNVIYFNFDLYKNSLYNYS